MKRASCVTVANAQQPLKRFAALKVDPTRAGAWTSLGMILKDEGDLLEGIVCLKRATELKPEKDIYAACLYFALIDAARYEDAHAEAIRFIDLVRTKGIECADDIRNDLEAMVDEPEQVKALFHKQRN
jgi:hypothetical protein